MAKYELSLQTDFDEFVEEIKAGVERRSHTISLEEETKLTAGDVRIHVVAYERYAYMGHNRSSLNITFVGCDGTVHLIGIGTGGSQAVFFKVNTWSEQAFLDTLEYAANDYMRDHDIKPLYVSTGSEEDEGEAE